MDSQDIAAELFGRASEQAGRKGPHSGVELRSGCRGQLRVTYVRIERLGRVKWTPVGVICGLCGRWYEKPEAILPDDPGRAQEPV